VVFIEGYLFQPSNVYFNSAYVEFVHGIGIQTTKTVRSKSAAKGGDTAYLKNNGGLMAKE
jgi:hypothetical protein